MIFVILSHLINISILLFLNIDCAKNAQVNQIMFLTYNPLLQSRRIPEQILAHYNCYNGSPQHASQFNKKCQYFGDDKPINSHRSAVRETRARWRRANIIALSILSAARNARWMLVYSLALTKLVPRPFADPFGSRQYENLTPSTSGRYRIFHFPVVKIGYLKSEDRPKCTTYTHGFKHIKHLSWISYSFCLSQYNSFPCQILKFINTVSQRVLEC